MPRKLIIILASGVAAIGAALTVFTHQWRGLGILLIVSGGITLIGVIASRTPELTDDERARYVVIWERDHRQALRAWQDAKAESLDSALTGSDSYARGRARSDEDRARMRVLDLERERPDGALAAHVGTDSTQPS